MVGVVLLMVVVYGRGSVYRHPNSNFLAFQDEHFVAYTSCLL